MKYPHIPHLSRLPKQTRAALLSDAYVFEKLDGGNVQVAVGDRVVTHGLRSGRLKGSRAPWAEEFQKWYWTNSGSIDDLPPGIYFGEFLAPHTISYKPEFANNFFLIDFYDIERQEFQDYNSALKKIKGKEEIMMPAPMLRRGSLTEEEIEQLVNGRSGYSVSGEREGVVIKNYSLQLFAKVKHPNFRNNPSLTKD